MSLEDLRDKLLNIADTSIKYARDLNVPSAEVFVINQSLTTVSDDNGKVDSRDGIVQGAGIRVAVGKQLGFASCTGFEDDSIKSAIEQAHNVAKRSPENPMFPGFTPAAINTREIAILAAPAPTIENSASSIFFPTSLMALIAPATTMVAVPC